jgi:acetolactate decarboxylase
MHTRSVPAQSKPYPTLKTVADNQPEFYMKDIEGTIVGFRCPQYVAGINIPGYHLHFLSSDKTKGGHILDFEVISASCKIDMLDRYTLTLPSKAKGFAGTDLSIDRSKELKAVEK